MGPGAPRPPRGPRPLPHSRHPACPPQVTVLLHLADVAVRLAWRRALDPDDHCIPYLTGLGDLLGTGLLALCFLAHGLLRTGVWPSSPLDPAPGPS